MTALMPMVERLLVAAVAAVALTLLVSVPGVAQTVSTPGEHHGVPENSTDGEYDDVLENGTILYQGDIGFDCRTLLEHFDEELFSTQRMVQACTEAGFPPEGALPETGGVPLLPALIALLSGAGLLTHAIVPRRHH